MSGETTPEYKVIGRSMPRHDARDKVFGQTKYADDFVVPGTIFAKVLRSKYAAARIVSIGTSRAEAMPGVYAVLTAKDVPNNETTSKFGQTHAAGGGFEGLYRVLADKKVRYMGEAVALVAAETLAQAEEAARAVDVVYDPQPGVFDPIEALKPDAYRVGEEESNVVCSYKVRKGDVDAGFAQADVVVEGEYRVPFGDHVFLEPESGTAWIDEDGVLTIRASTQVIEHFRDIADIMGLPHNRVRVIAPMLGGGFGGKEDITVEAYLALLAYRTKRPVRLTYTREESILAHSKRHPYVMRYKTGATKDGKLVALEAELVSDAGGYPFLSPWVLLYSVVMATGPYIIPNVKVDAVVGAHEQHVHERLPWLRRASGVLRLREPDGPSWPRASASRRWSSACGTSCTPATSSPRATRSSRQCSRTRRHSVPGRRWASRRSRARRTS